MRNFKKSFTLLSAALAISANGFADFQKSFSIENQYTIGTDTVNGQIYTNIDLEGASYDGVAGEPKLPCISYKFYVPQGQKVERVILESKNLEQVKLKNDIYPTQGTQGTGRFTIVDFVKPNEAIYRTSKKYPQNNVQYEVHTDLGVINTVHVSVYPIDYIPSQNEINIANQYTVIVKTTTDNTNDEKTHRMNEDEIHSYIQRLKSKVSNPEAIENNLEEIVKGHTLNEALRATSTWKVPFYEYVIITKRSLIPAFNQLLTWKRQKGLNAGIVAIEDILSDPAAAGGDLISGINDDAGKLRKYLRASKTDGNKVGKYVLLGGMSDIVPVRYGTGGYRDQNYVWHENNWWEEYGNMTAKIPSDFYYSRLDGNWNVDKDEYYGEFKGDKIMGSTQVGQLYVGRLMCRTEDDVERWTKKLLVYEQNPGLGDNSYLGRALITEADGLGAKSYIQNKLPSTIVPTTLTETPNGDNPTDPKAADVIGKINSTKYGLLTNCNHGSPCGYALATKGNNEYLESSKYQMISMDEYDDIPRKSDGKQVLWSTKHEIGNGFDKLTNFNHPAVFYSFSCENMPFDDYGNYYADYGMRNLGESFLCMNQGGGVAYLGNTRNGWGSSGPSLYSYFLNEVTRGTECRFGILEYYSKEVYYGGSYTNHWTVLTHNLAGCPETYFWKETPKKFGTINVSTDSKGTIWVNNVNLNNAVVCVTSANDGGASYRKTSKITNSNKNPQFSNVPSDFIVVVTLDGYLPYIHHSNECEIQNEIFSGTAVRDCKNIVAGAHVTTSKTEGDVIIKSGANVTFDADNTTRLEGGFQVKKGGQLKIK